MKESIFKSATFLRLIDEQGQLSLTNVALISVLIKLIMAPQASLTDVGALFLSLATYTAKKVINISQAKPVDTSALETSVTQSVEAIEALKSKVNTLSISAGFKTKI